MYKRRNNGMSWHHQHNNLLRLRALISIAPQRAALLSFIAILPALRAHARCCSALARAAYSAHRARALAHKRASRSALFAARAQHIAPHKHYARVGVWKEDSVSGTCWEVNECHRIIGVVLISIIALYRYHAL